MNTKARKRDVCLHTHSHISQKFMWPFLVKTKKRKEKKQGQWISILRSASVMCYHTGKNDKSEDWMNRAPRFGGNFKVLGGLNTFLWPPLHETTVDKRKADNEIALMWIGEAHGHSKQRTRGQLCILASLLSLSLRSSSSVHYCIFGKQALIQSCCAARH